jgi:septal ring factor EnvC (AmiA/AmiB activator)
MATPPVNNLPANPSIPLAPAVRAAYQDLYDKIQAGIDSTMDLATVQALNPWRDEVDQVLTKDDEYKLSEDTAIFEALQKQINYTNQGLKTLRDQISTIASRFAMAGDVIAAIDKVLSLFPGA